MPHSVKTWDHHRSDTAYARFNKRIAVGITKRVGTMTAAYSFMLLSLVSLPSVIKSGSLTVIVAWIAQTFLQLVLLPVIIVGQNVQAEASDSRSLKTFEDTEIIVDRLDTETQGGLQTVMESLSRIESSLTKDVK